MIKGLCVLAALTAILSPRGVSASEPVVPHRICSPSDFDFRGTFEKLLDSAYHRDFRSFRTLNGDGRYDFAPTIQTSSDGILDQTQGFAVFAGIQAQDESRPLIRKWMALFSADSAPGQDYNLFYAEIERSVWNDYANQFQRRESQWLLHFHRGCALKLVQETDVPYSVRSGG